MADDENNAWSMLNYFWTLIYIYISLSNKIWKLGVSLLLLHDLKEYKEKVFEYKEETPHGIASVCLVIQGRAFIYA